MVHDSFKAACEALGLLDGDKEYISAVSEAAQWSTGHMLRKLFVSMLLSNCLQNVGLVWGKCKHLLSEDMYYIPGQSSQLSGIFT